MMHQSQTKSPRSKHNSSGYPIDVFEVKDSFRYDTKIQPQTTKGAATASYVDIKFDKTKKGMSSTEKLVPSKLKEYQMKNLFPGFQIPNKKSGQGSETHKVGLSINLKDSSRSKIIMEEPPKKFSVPNAYIMPHSVIGSGSHRGPLVTSKGDLSDANSGPFTYMPFKRKGSQKLETEYEPQMHASITNKYGGFGQTGNVSNVLNDLTSLPLELTKSNSKTTVNNTTNNIITNIMIGEKVPSPKGSNNFSSQYQDLIRLINEKDKEIQKLNSEKTELKSTLNTLTSGVEDFKSMKSVLKEKERIITSLKNSLSVAIKESDVLRGEISAPEIQSGHSHKRSNKNSSFDIEGIKSLMYEIKSLEQDNENDTDQYETGNSQPDKVIKKTLSLKTKKSEPSHPGSAAANYRFATNNSVIEDQQARDLLGSSQESPLLKKNKDSPYYELIKGAKKDLKISLEGKKEPKSSGSDVQTTRVRTANTIVIKKRDPMGTPRKLQVNTDNLEAPAKTNYPNTTTGADIDVFKRKFSHDPRVITEGLREFGAKKNSVIDLGSPATHHSNSGKAQEQPGSLDIGKALGELKNKIARLLDRHQSEHKNLRNIQEGYLKKLNELLNKE